MDLAAFEKELQAQKERSRNAAAVDTDDWVELFPIRESIFTGYDTLTEKVRIARYRRVTSKGKTSYQLVFDRTPFYGNSGGQVGDIGMIESANERIPVVATEKENGLIIHIVNQLPENPRLNLRPGWTPKSGRPQPTTTPPRTLCTRRCARCSARMSSRRVRW